MPARGGSCAFSEKVLGDSSAGVGSGGPRCPGPSSPVNSRFPAASVAQSVRVPDCGSGCRGFKSHRSPQNLSFAVLTPAERPLRTRRSPGGRSLRERARFVDAAEL
jgi:hypothetical protein